MNRIVWTRRAVEDAQAIKSFIAQDSPTSATLVVQRILDAIEHLPKFPESGRIVPEYNDPTLRELVRPPYRIVYRLRQNELHIITIHHASRLLRVAP